MNIYPNKPIWREIETREVCRHKSAPKGGYSVLYTLTCGHIQVRKGSAEPKGKIIRCRECERNLSPVQ